jgi:hypothetical protein
MLKLMSLSFLSVSYITSEHLFHEQLPYAIWTQEVMELTEC